MNADKVNQLLRTRRSVFPSDYTGKRIADEIIWQLLENARWAPTHKLTEPWRFVVFTGDGLKQFADYQAKRYYERFFGTDRFLEKKYQKLKTKPLQCSHIIAVGLHRAEDSPVPEMEEIAAVACAVQNILLSAHAYGLGAYWSTGGLTYDETAKPFFSLGEEDKLMGFVYLGNIDGPLAESQRTDIRKFVTWRTTNR